MKDSLQYYKTSYLFTEINDFDEVIESIPGNPQCICQIAQGLIMHGAWLKFYGIPSENPHERYPLHMDDLLTEILTLDSRPITIPRLPENRIVASCREYATLACALLRAKGIPARSRCGFSVYLGYQGTLEDHWIVEYWNGVKWIMCDPQIDPFQLSMLYKWGINKVILNDKTMLNDRIPNPNDLSSRSDFLYAGKVWQLCRNGLFDPMKCGIDEHWGLWFVRGQLLRDFASLNKIELVPYECGLKKNLDLTSWFLMSANDSELSQADLALLDEAAALSLDADKKLHQIIQLYDSNICLQVPQNILQSR